MTHYNIIQVKSELKHIVLILQVIYGDITVVDCPPLPLEPGLGPGLGGHDGGISKSPN